MLKKLTAYFRLCRIEQALSIFPSSRLYHASVDNHAYHIGRYQERFVDLILARHAPCILKKVQSPPMFRLISDILPKYYALTCLKITAVTIRVLNTAAKSAGYKARHARRLIKIPHDAFSVDSTISRALRHMSSASHGDAMTASKTSFNSSRPLSDNATL